VLARSWCLPHPPTRRPRSAPLSLITSFLDPAPPTLTPALAARYNVSLYPHKAALLPAGQHLGDPGMAMTALHDSPAPANLEQRTRDTKGPWYPANASRPRLAARRAQAIAPGFALALAVAAV